MKIPKARVEAFVNHDLDANYLLKSVWLDAPNKRLLATDGHMAVRVEVEVSEADFSGPIPVAAFELIRKEIKEVLKINGKQMAPDPWVQVTCHEENVQIENLLTNIQHFVPRNRPDKGKFPNVDGVLPRVLGDASVTISRDLLGTILANMGGGSYVTLWIRDGEKAMVLASEMGDSIAMLMPAKGNLSGEEALARGRFKGQLESPPLDDEPTAGTEVTIQ